MSSFGNFHAQLTYSRLTPDLVTTSNGNLANVTPMTITTSVQPTEGNFLLIQCGGLQTRIPNDIAGWTKVGLSPSAGSDFYFYKVAGPSEPLSWSTGWVSAIQGGWIFYEFSNVDISNWYIIASRINNALAGVTSIDHSPYSVVEPSIWINRIILSAISNQWNPTNGFIPATANSLNIYYKGSYKRYTDAIASEVTGYLGAVGRNVFGGMLGIRGKIVYY